MTIVEFYDKTAIENIAGALLRNPERVILIGNNRKQMLRKRDYYQSILKKNGMQTEVLVEPANNNSIPDIVEVLTKIVEAYDDCVFDLTGGDELYLVAVGVVMNRYEGKVQCHRFNFRSNTVNDCDRDGNVCDVDSFNISVEENINIYGGTIITDPNEVFHTYPWDFNPEFIADVDVMWNICKSDTRLWNSHVGTLGVICEKFACEDPLKVFFNKVDAKAVIKQKGEKYALIAGILRALQNHGIINSLVMQDHISFRFKNDQIKQCLTIAGQVLELAVACRLKQIKDKNGNDLYHDVRVGVVMDWDAVPQPNDICKTINEIDIMAMKGAIPIFISCKNGRFDVNELYKLNTVAERFGGKYAKRVLIATELDKLKDENQIRARCDDMGIYRIENIDEMQDPELVHELTVICNK